MTKISNTMARQRNLDSAELFYSAAINGDCSTVATLLHPEFHIVEAQDLPFNGTYKGLEGLQTLGKQVFTHFQHFSVEPLSFTSNEDSVAVLISAKGIGKKTAEPFETLICEWLEFKAEKIVLLRPFYWDTLLINTV